MLISLENISKEYQIGTENVHALAAINLFIEHGEYLSIMGPSGSGKSTLMNIIGCLDTPSGGTYLLNGEKVSDMDDDHLASVRNRTIGFVFQTFNLLSADTAIHNVELPMLYAGVERQARNEKARKALVSVNLEHRLMHKPNEMSGGERQRVAIARALVNNPPLILADEPTGNLDSRTGSEIMNIFQNLYASGKTIVLVTHDINVARHAKRIVQIMDGKITSDERFA